MSTPALSHPVTPEDVASHRVLIRLLRGLLPELSGGAVGRLVDGGKVFVDGGLVREATSPLSAGSVVEVRPNAPRPRKALDEIPVVHVDAQVVVAVKPSGILSIPLREERESLAEQLRRILPRVEGKRGIGPPLSAVHRLDKGASGLLVFARTVPAQRALQRAFAAHDVERRYLALVEGEPSFERRTQRTFLVPDRGDGLKGSGSAKDPGAKEATTHFKLLRRLSGAALVECTLETGRTHQIRIHAAELGHPVVGEEVYIRDYPGRMHASPRLMLHAAVLGFDHPQTRTRLRFECEPPEEMAAMIERLSGAPRRGP